MQNYIIIRPRNAFPHFTTGAVVGVVGRSFVSIGIDFDPWSVKYNFYSFRVFLCGHTDMGIGESQLSESPFLLFQNSNITDIATDYILHHVFKF